LEKEDQINNGLKLEELIRKGTPAALAEANEMMKMMSGYDTSKKPDYKKEVNQEIERIESKVILLNDMLNQKSPQDFKKPDSTIEELYGSTKTAQGRLQKFIEDNDDEDRLNRLLELNDLINTVIEKYADLKNGKQVQKNSFDRQNISETKAAEPRGAINLIDFDDFSQNQSHTTNASFDPFAGQSKVQSGLLDEFSSLNFGSTAPQNGFQQPFASAQFAPLNGQQAPMFSQQSMTSQASYSQPTPGFSQSTATNIQQPFANLNNQPMSNLVIQAYGGIPSTQLQSSQMQALPMAGKPVFPSQQPVQSKTIPPSSGQPFGDLFSMPNASAKSNSVPQNPPSNDLLGLFGEQPTPKPVQSQATGMLMNQVPTISKECKTECNSIRFILNLD
jgi:hypothetical protein